MTVDHLTFLHGLEKVAAVMRGWGLHPITRLGRHVIACFLRDLSAGYGGFLMSGSLLHRGHPCHLSKGQIEPFMSELFKTKLRPGLVILDLGAHLGYYSVLAAEAGAKVYSFEPDPRTFPYLVRNVHANGFSALVVPVPKAVSSSTGRAALFLDNNDTPGQSSLFRRLSGVGRVEVDCVRLDEFLDEGIVVDVIKMDIEGAELHALMGMERVISHASKDLTMFIECNVPLLRSAGHSASLLVEWLRDHGFQVMKINEHDHRLSPPILSEIEALGSVNLCCTRTVE